MERFSPYFTDAAFPVEDLEPWAAYRWVYPEDSVDTRKIAYFFDYKMGDTVPDDLLIDTKRATQEWRDSWMQAHRPLLVYQRAPDWIQVVDRRDPKEPKVHAFQGLEAAVYDLCSDTDHSARRVTSTLQSEGVDVDVADVEGALGRFCELGLMIDEDGQYLSLALPVNANW